MTELERLVIAALAHDLPLLKTADGIASAGLRRVYGLAALEDATLKAILEQAEQYAAPAGVDRRQLLTTPLLSVFSRVQLYQVAESPAHFCQFAPLRATLEARPDLQAAFFPTSESDTTHRAGHIENFLQELDWVGTAVTPDLFDRFYFHLQSALRRYGWCLASHSEDVALTDHSQLTCAIAACLYLYHEAELTEAAVLRAAPAERFALLVGDLSGIQDYIFDITSTGAGGVARRLRARSFYLSVLADALSHQIARRFGVPLGNVIMASGGKFYVLLPARPDLEAVVARLRQEIDSWFHQEFNGEIAINLAYTTFPGDRFQASGQAPGFGEVVTQLSLKLNREKRRRAQGVLLGPEGWIESAFILKQDFRGAGICLSCGKFPGSRPGQVCGQCERDARLGSRLPRMRYLAYYDHTVTGDELLQMPGGFSARLLGSIEEAQGSQPYLVVKLNDPATHELAAYAASFRYLANWVPVRDGVPLSFDEIADQAQGRPLLGYVKADVDYLGMIFAQGLRRDSGGYDTAAHLAALSRELDLFFSGWVQHLLSRTPAYQNFYTVFSGGDDVFLLGPWDQAAALGLGLHADFAAFVGQNPDLTFSAGVLFTKGRYPIARAAQEAEAVLEKSKEHEWVDAQGRTRTRDQITVLGDTLRWTALPPVLDTIKMLQVYPEGQLRSAFLYNLVEYGHLYRLWVDEKKVEGLRYKPLFAYNIARNLRQGDPNLHAWADGLLQSLHGQASQLPLRHLGLIATYVLFSRRNVTSKNNPESNPERRMRK